jgi:hypothetical protein
MVAQEGMDGRPSWLVTSMKKRDMQRAAIGPFRTAEYPSNADAITGINDIAELGIEIKNGRLKAYDVTMAYIQR